MRRRLIALVLVLLLIPVAYLGSSKYQPDFVVWYVNFDPQAVDGVPYLFLEAFETSAVEGHTCFAYVDFGTAEDYRRYRNDSRYSYPPDFLGNRTPRDPHEYFVKVRDPQRLEIIEERIDIAKAKAYDGVLLDLVDVYVYRLDEYPDAYERFCQAIENVTAYAHSLGMKVVVNIGSGLDYARDLNVDGIMREVIFFYEGQRVPEEYSNVVLKALDEAKSRGLMVFAIDEPKSVDDFFYAKEHLQGFLTFLTDGDYDHMPRRYEESKLRLRLERITE